MTFAADLSQSLEPVATPDLDTFLAAIGSMFQPVDDLVRDSELGEGWSPLLDAQRAPTEALPWLGQLVGVRLMAGLSEPARRQRIAETDGFRRGSLAALVGAARQHLTGLQRVVVRERDGSAYRLTVITFDSQTPYPDRVAAALAEQKPAVIVLDYRVETGQDYRQLHDERVTYDAVRTDFTDYDAVRANT